jgi:type VII secretion system (Wss) protein YukD
MNKLISRVAQTGLQYVVSSSHIRKESKMSDVPVTLVLPSGGTRNAEVPDDVPVKELLPELTTSLELPVTGPDGRAMSYRIDSKALGRELKEEETLSQAGIPQNDRLMMTADVTAG